MDNVVNSIIFIANGTYLSGGFLICLDYRIDL